MATQQRDMTTHIKVIAALLIVFYGLTALLGLGMAGFGVFVSQADSQDLRDPETGEEFPVEVASAAFFILAVILLAFSIFGIVTGVSMLSYKPWSRVAGIVLGALALPSIPLGTGFGIYAIWALIQDETKWLFEGGGPHAGAGGRPPPGQQPPGGWEPVDPPGGHGGV